MVKLAELNRWPADKFTDYLGAVFEHSPWIAEQTSQQRPFATLEQLHTAMCETVQSSSHDEKLALIRAHPDLVGRAILTTESESEQASAGLGDLTTGEVSRFQSYNREY